MEIPCAEGKFSQYAVQMVEGQWIVFNTVWVNGMRLLWGRKHMILEKRTCKERVVLVGFG